MFGNTKGSTGFGGFGATPASSSSGGFGAASGGFSFGSTATTGSNSSATSSGFGLFGASSSSSSSSAAVGGFNFGSGASASSASTGGFSLGASSSSQAAASSSGGFGGFGFGGGASSSSSSTATAGGFSFGSGAPGSSSSSAPAAGNSFGFGTGAGGTSSSSAAGGFGFGVGTGASSSSSSSAAGFSFGSSSSTAAGTSGSSSSGGFGFGIGASSASSSGSSSAGGFGFGVSSSSSGSSSSAAGGLGFGFGTGAAGSSSSSSGPSAAELEKKKAEDLAKQKEEEAGLKTMREWEKELETGIDHFARISQKVATWDEIVRLTGDEIMKMDKGLRQVEWGQLEVDSRLDCIEQEQGELEEALIEAERALNRWSLYSGRGPRDEEEEREWQRNDSERNTIYGAILPIDAYTNTVQENCARMSIERRRWADHARRFGHHKEAAEMEPLEAILKVIDTHAREFREVEANIGLLGELNRSAEETLKGQLHRCREAVLMRVAASS